MITKRSTILNYIIDALFWILYQNKQILDFFGIPEPLEIERKFLLADNSEVIIPVPFEDSYIEQTYLLDGSRARVRYFDTKTIQFAHTLKKQIGPGEYIEHERRITKNKFNKLLLNSDKSKRTIQKIRRCFLWGNQYFELDIFCGHYTGLRLLEIELNNINECVNLPPFLSFEKEVTGDYEFTNFRLAGK